MKKLRLLFPETAMGGGGSATDTTPATGGATGTPPNGAPAHWATTMEGLPDDIRTSPALKDFKSPVDAIKAYHDVQPLLGRDKAPIPKDWNDPVQVKAFNEKIGVPDTAEKYELGKVLVSKLPKDIPLDEKLVGKFQGFALEAGLTPRQAGLVAEKFMANQIEEHQTSENSTTVERANALNKFRTEQGSQFDTTVAFARKALANFADPDLQQLFKTTPIGDDPRFIKMLAKIGATLKEDTVHPNGTTGQLQADSPDAAAIRIAELRKDEKFMTSLTKASDPNHKAAVEEWTRLNGKLGPKNK